MATATRFNRPTASLIALPRCSNQLHAHLPMQLQPGHTAEQRFCGTWYRCQLCPSGLLFQSPALRSQLATAKRTIRAAKKNSASLVPVEA